MLDERRAIATRTAAASIELFFEMRGLDGHAVAVPPAGREPPCRVRHVVGGMGPTVHPDRAPLLIRAEILSVRNDLLRRGILFFPSAELERTPIDVCDV